MNTIIDSVESAELQHHGSRTPVTALLQVGTNVVLAGQGGRLLLYELQSGTLIGSWKIFESQAVHGIAKHSPSGRLLIWGGQQVRVAHVNHDLGCKPELVLEISLDANDWIFDVAFSPSSTDNIELKAAIVTAHNALAVAQVSDATAIACSAARLVSITPGSNCILYAAHIKWLSASQCLIASGTAFGDIIVWSCTIPSDYCCGEAEAQIHFTFSAHEGSVFGVQLSDTSKLSHLNNCILVLASCSDDRTIRLWDVSDLSKRSPPLARVQQDTGFGSLPHEDAQVPQCLAKVMGHISRIWDIRLVTSPGTETNFRRITAELRTAHTLTIVSFGEDASVIYWEVLPSAVQGEQFPFTLKQISAATAHAGKSIWSVTTSEHGEVTTGGADGSIVARDEVVTSVAPEEVNHQQFPIPGSCMAHSYRSYAFTGPGKMVATTDEGFVVSLILEEGIAPHPVRTPRMTTEDLSGYSILCGINGAALIGGKGGKLWIYEESARQILEATSLRDKVMGLFAYDFNDETSILLATCIITSDPALLMRTHVSPDDGHVEIKMEKRLCLHSNSISTSFTCCSTKLGRHYLVGCRDGSIVLFDGCQTEELLRPAATIHGAHHGEAVTSMCSKADESSAMPSCYIYSTGRDGTVAVHRYAAPTQQHLSHMNDTGASLLHRIVPPFGPRLEQLMISPEARLWISGFRSKQFVIHDLTAQRDIMTVECGGAHRNWAFQPTSVGGTFVWTKASKMYKHTQIGRPYHSINSGGHGREIKAVAVSSNEPQIIATGAEDTNIKLHSYFEDSNFQCLQTLRKHKTGIQHLQWSAKGSHLFSSGGFEEFFIWRITPDVPIVGIGVVCESEHPRSGGSDLRIMGFEANEPTPSSTVSASFVVSMAYSDSTVKTWAYEASSWKLLASGDYRTACLTSISSIADDTLLSAATDGHVALWYNGSKLQWKTRHRIHQNAVLDAIVHKLADGTTLLVTGGDDNAIGITRLAHLQSSSPSSPSSGLEGVHTLLLPRAHAAAVTALAVFPSKPDISADNVSGGSSGSSSSDTTLLLVSASIDQRIKLWRVRVDTAQPGIEGVEVERVCSVHTAVADVAGMSTLVLEDGSQGVVVCGVGMDVWRVPVAGGDDRGRT